MLGLTCQCALVGAALVAPLVAPQALPKAQVLVGLFSPRVSPPPPLRAAHPAPPQASLAQRVFQYRLGQLFTPSRIPSRAAIIDEPPMTAVDAPGGPAVPGGVLGTGLSGVPGGIFSALPVAPPAPAPAPAPPAKAAPKDPIRVRIGGLVQQGRLVHEVTPLYPPLARAARNSGQVELMAIIGTDGTVRQLQVLKGHPLLTQAALDAVRQWRYRPATLNGDPVEVLTNITVMFRLQ
jgi:protein TonB